MRNTSGFDYETAVGRIVDYFGPLGKAPAIMTQVASNSAATVHLTVFRPGSERYEWHVPHRPDADYSDYFLWPGEELQEKAA